MNRYDADNTINIEGGHSYTEPLGTPAQMVEPKLNEGFAS